jgi:WhiB family redox-sensing transcriptional regulator
MSRTGVSSVPRPLAEDWDWQVLGRCRELEPDVFFPEEAGRVGLRAREEAAKRICRGCPVLNECRNHALAMRETHGVWGAMSAAERARHFITAGTGPAAD